MHEAWAKQHYAPLPTPASISKSSGVSGLVGYIVFCSGGWATHACGWLGGGLGTRASEHSLRCLCAHTVVPGCAEQHELVEGCCVAAHCAWSTLDLPVHSAAEDTDHLQSRDT
eukprot:15118718-Alexandrium_andersonii.AAC.2